MGSGAAPEEGRLAHDLVILVRRGEKGEQYAGYALHGSLKEARAAVPVAWVFCSLEDAEELIVGRGYGRGVWRAARLTKLSQVQGFVAVQMKRGFFRACVNPPPAGVGRWRVLNMTRLTEWARAAQQDPGLDLSAFAEKVAQSAYVEGKT